MQMDQIFRPLTSSPFRRDDTYTEILPCEALRPYICCFWGTSQPLQTCDAACESLVTPDTCMDILIDLDTHGSRSRAGSLRLTTARFWPEATAQAILSQHLPFGFTLGRFPCFPMNPWCRCKTAFLTRIVFSGFDTAIGGDAALRRFAGGARPFCAAVSFGNSAGAAEKPAVMNAIHSILKQEGRAALSEAAAYACVSPRQLERFSGSW